MNRSKREDYKRFVVFCLASLIIIAQTAIFAYVWYDFYSGLILKPFWRKGNWVLILIYALIYLMFAKLNHPLDLGKSLYLFQTVRSQKASGDLRRP